MSNNNGSSVFTLMAGAAVGAALGLLLAPETGEDTRKRIVRSAQKFADPIIDKVNDNIEDVYEYAGSIYNKAMKKEEPSSGVFMTLLLAVPVGVALGVLFAPAKGAETRKYITDSAQKGMTYVNDFTGMGGEANVEGQKQNQPAMTGNTANARTSTGSTKGKQSIS